MADKQTLQSGEISKLIDSLLEIRDPTVVGLRRILKTKREQGKAFPCRTPQLDQLAQAEATAVFDSNERRILELEREIQTLKTQLKQKEQATAGVAEGSRAQGYAKGLRDGEAKGYEKGSTEAKAAAEKLRCRVESVLSSFEKSRRALYGKAENAVVSLAVDIAEKIVATELTLNQSIIVNVVSKALSHIADKDKLVMRISPADAATLEARTDFWMPVNERLTDIRIEQDERVGPGGCVIESSAGVVDARLDVQLLELRGLVASVWQNSAAPEIPIAAAIPGTSVPSDPQTEPITPSEQQS